MLVGPLAGWAVCRVVSSKFNEIVYEKTKNGIKDN